MGYISSEKSCIEQKSMVPICLYCFILHEIWSLILRKIFKIVATRCRILRLKCTKFDLHWGSAPDPAGGAYSAPPNPLAGFKGPTFKGGYGMVWYGILGFNVPLDTV